MSGPVGVILAAGRGSRLGHHTEDRPKCLVELGGSTLLDHQRTALAAAGIERIVAVTGYRSELIEATGIETVRSSRWSQTNMVGTMRLALETLPPPYVFSYSDIVYGADPVRSLIRSQGDLAITYDVCWEEQWRARFDDPATDAESFAVGPDGAVIDIGHPITDLHSVQGQFMGLLAVTAQGRHWILDHLGQDAADCSLDTTTLLRQLIARGRRVQGIPVEGGWAEIDTPRDLAHASRLLAAGMLETEEAGSW